MVGRRRRRCSCPSRSIRTRIRVPVVIARRRVQKIAAATVPVPPGAPWRQDGALAAEFRAIPVFPVVTHATVLRDKIKNEGHLLVDLVLGDPDPDPCPGVSKTVRKRVALPFVDVLDVRGVRPGDLVHEAVRVETVQVAVLPVFTAAKAKQGPGELQLHVTAVLRVCLVVLRPKVITVKGVAKRHRHVDSTRRADRRVPVDREQGRSRRTPTPTSRPPSSRGGPDASWGSRE